MPVVQDAFTTLSGNLQQLVGTFAVTGGQVTCNDNANGYGICQYTTVTDTANQFAEISVATLDTTTSRAIGVSLRMGTAGQNYQVAVNGAAGGSWELSKFVGFTKTTISGATAITLTLPVRVRLEAIGSTIRVVIGGVTVGTYTDTSVATGNKIGLYTEACNSTCFADDLYAGDLYPPPMGQPSQAASVRASTY